MVKCSDDYHKIPTRAERQMRMLKHALSYLDANDVSRCRMFLVDVITAMESDAKRERAQRYRDELAATFPIRARLYRVAGKLLGAFR